MNTRWKLIGIGLVATVVGFLFEAPGPIGGRIWPMASGIPQPEGTNLVLLTLMGAFEAVAFGLGVVFLVAGWNWVKARTGTAGGTWAVYLSVAWLLVNWVPHTALHMAHGNITKPSDFTGLVGIEYGFHLTLMAAGAVCAWFVLRGGTTARVPATNPSATSSKGKTA